MDTLDPVWRSGTVRALIADHDVGGLIRFGRELRGWRQVDLGRQIGYSAATISRLERNRRATTDLRALGQLCECLGIPANLLGAAIGMGGIPADSVAAPERPGEDGSVRRREFVAGAAGLAVPVGLLRRVDEALVLPPSGPGRDVAAQLRAVRVRFDSGDLSGVIRRLPTLVGAATELTERRGATPDDHALATRCYVLATHGLSKVGRYDTGRVTADRATRFAAGSGSALRSAEAARALGVVLRHRGEAALADRVTLAAADRLDRAGLDTTMRLGTYAQLLCTCAYNAAHTGDRERALELMTLAEQATRRLPGGIGKAQIALYRVGVHWSLGDADAAVRAGAWLRPGHFPTAERRARLYTDLARAWWLRGNAEHAARALLAARREVPAELRERPSIRRLADAVSRGQGSAAVLELRAALV
jgi:transcriptional regulator with XRE-family HTH domain